MAETLTLEAAVVDKFSRPLTDLRNKLREASKVPDGVKMSAREFVNLQASVRQASEAISGTYSSAIGMLGIQSLAAAGAIAAVSQAIRGFAASTTEIKALSRETGIAAQNFRVLESAAPRFSIPVESIRNGLKQFGDTMRDFRRGGNGNPAFATMLTAAPELTRKIMHENADQALNDVLAYLAAEPNKQRAGQIAQELFGAGIFARFGHKGVAGLQEALKDAQGRIGIVSPEDQRRADAFTQVIEKLRATVEGLGHTIGSELAPPLTAALQQLDEFIQKNRGEIGDGVQSAFIAIKDAVEAIDWAEVGREAKKVGAVLLEVAQSMKSVADAIERLGILGGNPASAGESAATNIRRALGLPYKGALGDARKRLSDFDAADERLMSPYDRSQRGTIRDQLVGEIKKLEDLARDQLKERGLSPAEIERKIKEGTKSGVVEGLQELIQKQSLDGAEVGGGGGGGLAGLIHKASLGGGGSVSTSPGARAARSAAFGMGGVVRASRGEASNANFSGSNADVVRQAASNLGVSAEDLATVIGYESGGTFSPRKWGGAGGRYLGLIQAGPSERAQYGINENQTFAEQMAGAVRFLRGRGFKNGMGIRDLYSTILAGSPGHFNRSDGHGTVDQHLAKMDRGLARRFLNSGRREADLSHFWPGSWAPEVGTRRPGETIRSMEALGLGGSVNHSAALDITINGGQGNIRSKSTGDGFFKEINVRRGRSMVQAQEDI